jgi:hypothetical protein
MTDLLMSFRERVAVYYGSQTKHKYIVRTERRVLVLWHVDPLLGDNREIGDRTAGVAKQRPADNRGMVLSARSAKQRLNSNRGTVFRVRSVLRCYKQDYWKNLCHFDKLTDYIT